MSSSSEPQDLDALRATVTRQAGLVRQLKADGAEPVCILITFYSCRISKSPLPIFFICFQRDKIKLQIFIFIDKALI